jgi:hypothetical protein
MGSSRCIASAVYSSFNEEHDEPIIADTEGRARVNDDKPALPQNGFSASPTDEPSCAHELWDGLLDEQGPIPAFGPVRTDESGRVLMSDEERVARRDAAIRALAAVGGITDETDTDEVWAKVSRGLEEAS